MATWSTLPARREQRIASARVAASLSAPLTWRPALAIVGLLLGILTATNRWMSWGAGLVYARANDEHAYLTIAHAAPGLPSARIADQHAQRWPLHWLVGALADVTGARPEVVYRWAALALALAVCVVLAAVLMRIGASTATGLLALAVFALNPYALRYYALAPGYLADLAFELGVAVLLLGLVTRRLGLVLGALVVGTLARQTMLPVALVVALWVALGPDWRALRPRARLAAGAATLALPLLAWLAVTRVAADFSRPSVPLGRLTIVDHVLELPGSAGDLLGHLAHVAVVLLVVAGLLGAALWTTRARRLPSSCWVALAIGLAIVAQAVALNPDPVFDDWTSYNEPRLTALGLGALAVALAAARPAIRPGFAVLALGLLAVGSLHQSQTIASTGSAGATVALQGAVALTLLGAALLGGQRTPVPRDG